MAYEGLCVGEYGIGLKVDGLPIGNLQKLRVRGVGFSPRGSEVSSFGVENIGVRFRV